MKMLYIKHRSGKRMNNFAMSAILAARELGIDFTIANNMSMADKEHFAEVCSQYNIRMVHIDFDRNPLGVSNVLAAKQLVKLMKEERYDIVHCNTPTGGVLGRLCAAWVKIPKVIYMAHGFHFWKGAPVKNWLLYYPVERFLAHFTDRLITINQEDYRAAQKFHYKKGGCAEYVPGVGIEVDKFQRNDAVRARVRQALGITGNERVLLSVGEVNQNKNHRVVIEALAKLNRRDVRYVVCGVGPLMEENQALARKLGVGEQVLFAGYRADVKDFYQAADVFVISSFREGLPVAPMEAISAGLPCVASRIRGNVDLFGESRLLFSPSDAEELCAVLQKVEDKAILAEELERNRKTLERFSMAEAVSAIRQIYTDVIHEIP